MIDQAPRFDSSSAEALARETYGLEASAEVLTSERDQNFLLTTATGERVVLKIANALESRALIEAQQEAMRHIAASLATVPRVVPTLSGETLVEVLAADGRRHLVWAITHLPGTLLVRVRHRSTTLLSDFGRAIAELGCALADFDHPAIRRDFHWDLAHGRRVVEEHRQLLAGDAIAHTVDTLLERFDTSTAPILPRLRRSAIHNDLNDHNILVDALGDRVVGIVDFGDMVHSYTIGDLAIAAAYVSLESDDPLESIAALVRSYNSVTSLTDDDVSALYGLVMLRLCTSACLAAVQRREDPTNDYLDVSQRAIRRVLPALAKVPFALATAVFRDSCGLEPVPTSPHVRQWLAQHTPSFAPVLDVDVRVEPTTVLNLSIDSPLVSGDPGENTERHLTARVAAVMRASGVRVAVGRYDEPRLLYVAHFFGGDTPYDARRTVHIGLDLFAEAGTPVHAPMDGVVHAFADNREPQDYGPVVILRHEADDGVPFFTLYGHLSRVSLEQLHVGMLVRRGAQFATLGAASENVGWTPHLHLQVITDTLDLDTDFPGVAPAAQRGVWRSLSPDPNLVVGVPAHRFPPALDSTPTAVARRRAHTAGNLSIAYRDPVRIVRGWKQYLYDDDGRRYIDAYNNVPHVGHCHPRVVRAAAEQMAVLNTNTRYMNDSLAEYAERLLATLPAPLEVCVFLSSASEANELALRMARAFTGRRDMIVLDAAYHGNTTTLIDISPYKHAGPGGEGAPDWVHVAPMPDDYRGPYRRNDTNVGARYAADVGAIVERIRATRGLSAFIAETCPSVGGQLMLPAGYLAGVYAHVRAAGGVCIADEVQTGLGRMGTHFWAFEAHGVIPDIVVMGKPLGNGHPVAAVVTTRAIADAFDNGMEFFSTFGGNTVSCATGLAVLDVMRDEALQAHAREVGDHLLAQLRSLADLHPLVGDVRGSGLFLGVELVRDRETLEPATDEATCVANRMRELGVLLGTDGPFHNVIKIRPPMPFSRADGDHLVECLDRALSGLSR